MVSASLVVKPAVVKADIDRKQAACFDKPVIVRATVATLIMMSERNSTVNKATIPIIPAIGLTL